MTDLLQEIRPGIWVFLSLDASRLPPPLSQDVAATEGMPGWRAAEFLAGRRALRHLLSVVVPGAHLAQVGYSERGRPYLVGWPRLGISITHDNHTAAACVATGFAVGVDVQHPPETVGDSLLRWCLRERTDELHRMPMCQRATEFAWVWTVQEACVKAAGIGISGKPWSIDVSPRAPRGRWGAYEWISLRGRTPVPCSCAFTDLSGYPA